jgi:hypothetical protein
MLESANRAIWSAYARARRRRLEVERLPGLIQAIDALLFELEELNLQGVDRVPADLREKSARVLVQVPAKDPEQIQVRYRVVTMMDTLFRAQELIFRARDPERPPATDEEDEDLSA